MAAAAPDHCHQPAQDLGVRELPGQTPQSGESETEDAQRGAVVKAVNAQARSGSRLKEPRAIHPEMDAEFQRVLRLWNLVSGILYRLCFAGQPGLPAVAGAAPAARMSAQLLQPPPERDRAALPHAALLHVALHPAVPLLQGVPRE